MSIADLKAYGIRAASDPVVRAKAKSIGLQNVKGQSEYAETLGLTFDEADLQALAHEVKPKGELSERDLSSVSGGIVTTTAAAVASVAGAVGAIGTAVTGVTSSTSAGGW